MVGYKYPKHVVGYYNSLHPFKLENQTPHSFTQDSKAKSILSLQTNLSFFPRLGSK